MEYHYKAYIRNIDGTPYYFVKKYISLPEILNNEDILEGYGMHRDFEKACVIAKVMDKRLQRQLFCEVEDCPLAKVIELPGKILKDQSLRG